ncbi:GH36-type glycosyl hydrolase domain-containing protein [Clostridium polynesiense]|uniref:GH36-type glycosyl hydrolase domain-containing protein n=1 Tax=Clostridium polynesiense TaxID=1325933 RepID=UPI00069423D9|nr:glucoamylase family protein [Clostridium polynesiense]
MVKSNSRNKKSILINMENNYHTIVKAYEYINGLAEGKIEIINACQWLLDNIYLIEKEYRFVKKNLPLKYYSNLPWRYESCISAPEIYFICADFIKKSQGEVEESSIREYISDLKDRYCFSMGELWAVPLMLKVILLEYIAELTQEITEIQEDKITADNFCEDIIGTYVQGNLQEKTKGLMKEIQRVSTSFAERTIRILRDNSLEIKEIIKWIEGALPEEIKGIEECIKKQHSVERSLERKLGNSITALRNIDSIDWKKFFEEVSEVEKILSQDPSSVYKEMDFETRDYYRHCLETSARLSKVAEKSAAEEALKLAQEAFIKDEEFYRKHIGYYIVDIGREELYKRLNPKEKGKQTLEDRFKRHPYFYYFGILSVSFLVLEIILLSIYFKRLGYFSISKLIISIAVTTIPLLEVIISILNWSFLHIIKPSRIPKLDLQGKLHKGISTMVVIPVLISNKHRVKELIEDLEVYYLANKSENLYFTLLADYKDFISHCCDEDKKITLEALKEIKLLNNKYCKKGEEKFFFLSRNRKYNESMGLYLGWERKRGKLMEFMELLRGKEKNSFNVISSDITKINKIKYLITLDADTMLPRNCVFKLVGAMEHPLNRPVMDGFKDAISRGYGIMQPRISVSIEAWKKSRFSMIFSGEIGLDTYTTAVSDIYQDLFQRGIFTGKGIINIDTFYEILKDKIPENTVLSHDLLEGGYAGAALVSDIEFIDGYPSTYKSSCLRLHRWVRGDWQLIPWLWSRGLSALCKWQITDNLRRSLLAPSIIILILSHFLFLPQGELYLIIALLSVGTPLLFHMSERIITSKKDINLKGRFSDSKDIWQQVFFIISFIPHQSILMIDAVIRSLYRVFISRRKLLQWQTAEEAETSVKNSLISYIKTMWGASIIALIVLMLSMRYGRSTAWFIMPVCILWFLSPLSAYLISIELKEKKEEISSEDEKFLREISRKTYAYYEDFITEEENYLAPDNYQEEPYKGTAHRTSPTNIGMGLISSIAAYDLGYIGIGSVIEKTGRIIESIKSLDKFHGHLYNWYDTKTMKPLWPKYISTVDSGNLVGYYYVVIEALKEYKKSTIVTNNYVKGLIDTLRLAEKEEHNKEMYKDIIISLSENICDLESYNKLIRKIWSRAVNYEKENIHLKKKYWNSKVKKDISKRIKEIQTFFPWMDLAVNKFQENKIYKDLLRTVYSTSFENLADKLEIVVLTYSDSSEGNEELLKLIITGIDNIKRYIKKLDSLCICMERLAEETDFKVLYNQEKKLFSIGYDMENQSLGDSCYDLLASEARAASFIAIAKGDVGTEHWFRLGRAMTSVYGRKTLVSWSGTMFEYFMPLLIMKPFPKTLLQESYNSIFNIQKKYCDIKGIPYGVSESAYYYFDAALNYQYKAFGIPEAGLKRGLGEETVVSPYSAVLAMGAYKNAAIKELRNYVHIGMLGRYGFFEALDYTPSRVPKGKKNVAVKCYMVHHQGMSLMAFNNALNNNIFQERFHRVPMVRAAEQLLQERVPKALTYLRKDIIAAPKHTVEKQKVIVREYRTPHTEMPEINLLSNGEYSMMITNSGSGYSKVNKMHVYRWREDPTLDSTGMFFYVKNINSNEYWSAAYEPCKNSGESYEVKFSLDKALFKRKDGNIITKMEASVIPDINAEIRRLTFTNKSSHERTLEVTSYMEITLCEYNSDLVHPAFSNLFITTEYDEENKCLLASRRPRAKAQKKPYAMHFILENENEAPLEYETSRANFIGRNRDKSNPSSMDNDAPLHNNFGIVLDPIFSLRRRLKLRPGESRSISFITGTSDSKKEALNIVSKVRDIKVSDKIFEECYRASQMDIKYLGIMPSQGIFYQKAASRIVYGFPDKYKEITLRNISMHQKDLWPYGISGDLPIILFIAREDKDIDIIRQLLNMYRYWKEKGIEADLIIYNKKDNSYDDPLKSQILQLLNSINYKDENSNRGKVNPHSRATMGGDMLNFIQGIARIFMDSLRGDIAEQLEDAYSNEDIYSSVKEEALDERYIKNINEASVSLTDDNKKTQAFYKDLKYSYELAEEISFSHIPKASGNSSENTMDLSKGLEYYNGYGGFNPEDNSYVIILDKDKTTPAPWINVISNGSFGFHISECGSSYTWALNSRENKITPWNNDAVRDISGEALYIRDEITGEFWSLSSKPIREDSPYIIKHSYGYSTFTHNSHEIQGEMTCFVPLHKTLKIIKVKLKNTSNKHRNLSVFYYAQLVLGVSPEQTYQYISTDICKSQEFIYAMNPYSEHFGVEKAFLKIIGGEDSYFTGSRREFLGRGGHISCPLALKKKNLSNHASSGEDPCLAQQCIININPEEDKEFYIILGQMKSVEEIEKNLEEYKEKDNIEREFNEVKSYWSDLLNTIQVSTPDKTMDIILNGWLIYQNLSCRYWARSAFYQSGGAYGYRDQLQDSLALGILKPDFTKKQILRSAERQFIEGDVQHWWHPIVNSGIRTRFSDDLLWLPYVTAEYIRSTGDYEILNEDITYLQDRPLSEGEDERYSIVPASQAKGSLYEHCIKSIEKGLNFGEHNIPLMGSGDWNDGMSTVGNKGRGESIWLGWFLYDILNKFKDICCYIKDEAREKEFISKMQFIRDNIEKHGWDGGWYRRAYFDDGTPLGSAENEECRIDSIAQSWSAISGGGRITRVKEAMEAVERYLVREENELILLLAPPFNNSNLEPGYIKGYVPGVRENGGQYTHAAVWFIMAYTMLGEGNKAWKYFNMINPVNHSRTALEAKNYKVEPYVMSADVYLKEPFSGRGGWSWYTGAAGWMYRVGIENILGFKIRDGKGFEINPCVPDSWREYSITYKTPHAVYNINILRRDKAEVIMNGKILDDNFIPFQNGGTHYIEVRFI